MFRYSMFLDGKNGSDYDISNLEGSSKIISNHVNKVRESQ